MPNEAILAKVGYVPQLQTMKQVTLPITVEEFIVFGLYRSFGYLKVPRKKDYVRVAQALEEFGLKAYQKAKFNTLSGGLKQRVMLMRAILQTPKLYIFDEYNHIHCCKKSEFCRIYKHYSYSMLLLKLIYYCV